MLRFRFPIVFALALIVYAAVFGLYTQRFPKVLVNPDLPVYSTLLLQTETPTLYACDPTYGDGRLLRTFWSSGYLYLRVFQGLYAITNRNMSSTLALLQLIPGLIAVVTFYWGLSALRKDRWLTLALSISLSLWLVLGFNEGIPTLYYLAATPVLLRLLWTVLLEPSLARRPVVYWQVLLVGALIALSSPLLNSVSGLGFSLFALGCVTLQWLSGSMRLSSYAVFLLGVVSLLVGISVAGVGGTNVHLDTETALHYINGDFVASVLTRGSFLVGAVMTLFNTPFTLLFYLPLTGCLALAALRLRTSRRQAPVATLLYIGLSWVLCSSLLGSIGVVLYLYFAARALVRKTQKFDLILMTGMTVGQLIGPVLMWIVVGVWSLTQWHTLALVLFQMFRFAYFSMFVAGAAILFMTDDLTDPVTNTTLKRFLQIVLVSLIPLQTQPLPSVGLPLVAILIITLGLICSRYRPSAVAFITRRISPSVLRGAVLIGACGLTGLAFWSSPVGEILFRYTGSLAPNPQFKSLESYEDYLHMTEWLRLNTPQDSLIHFEKRWDWGFFRYLSQRSLLFNWMDDTLGPSTSEMYARERDIIQSLETTPLVLFGRVAQHYGINYLVLSSSTLSPLPYRSDEGWYRHQLVYENSTYRIYKVERLMSEPPLPLFGEALRQWWGSIQSRR